MCGIAGIITPNNKHHKVTIKAMVSTLNHRGPDSNGFKISDDFAFGHARLSIVDLETGEQPMSLPDKSSTITFNGEIYGYKNIKNTLKNNFLFRTKSDTEVILALYQQYGMDFLQNMPGIFAFGLYDAKKRQLICARDRFGEKPLYYARGKNGEFIFASEIKAILASKLVRPEIDQKALNHYLKKLYIHPTDTIYKNIHTLPPAHYLVFKNNSITIQRYWELPRVKTAIDWEKTLFQTQNLFEEAVKRQMVADVPVSAFLSGGIDSTAVVYYAKKHNPDLKTFSFGFGDYINEVPVAQKTAKQFNTNHTNLHAEDFNIKDLILKMGQIYDEPLADSSTLPSYLIAREAAKHGKVVLTGDGGDELLAGYAAIYSNLLFFDRDNGMPTYLKRQIKEFLKYQQFQSVFKQHLKQNNYFNDLQTAQMTGVNSKEYQYHFKHNGTLSDALNTDLLDFMPGDILVKTDRASMANSLELRAPFLDVDFASYCISIPANYKLNRKNNTTKWFFKEALKEALPLHVLNQKKQGFQSPINAWLKMPQIQKLLKDYVFNKDNSVYNLIDYNSTMQNYKQTDIQIWILLTLSIWYNENFLSFDE